MPKPSSGIIVVEKPSTATNHTRITTTTTTTTTNTSHTSNTYRQHPHSNKLHNHQQHLARIQSYPRHHNLIHLSQRQQQHQLVEKQSPSSTSSSSKYLHCYDANKNPQLSSQQHSSSTATIAVDGKRLFQEQQNQSQLQQSTKLEEGQFKLHTSSSSSSLTSLTLTSSSLSSKSSAKTESNLHIQAIKAGPMPHTNKQHHQQQQQIIQHTTCHNSSGSNNNQQLHHPSSQQHVQQVHLATTTTSIAQHHQQQQQQSSTPQQNQTHMIQVSEEFLEQAQAQNHNTNSNSSCTASTTTTTTNMMISATGEVIQQQQIFKIVSTDAATGNVIIDTSGSTQNPNSNNASKVLLSNLTVLSKQQTAGGNANALGSAQQQSGNVNAGQTINFVNAKQLYAASTATNPAGSAGVMAVATASLGKHQKFTVSSANLAANVGGGGGNFKTTALKQTTNTQYLHQTGGSQQKISMTSNRNMQMLTSTRLQTSGHVGSGVIASSAGGGNTAQTMILQQSSHKFMTTNNINSKSLGGGAASGGTGNGNMLKKPAAGTLRMSNNNLPAAAANKLMMQSQTPQGVKTFITQTAAVTTPPNHSSQLSTMQQQQSQHHVKGGGKSKFVKQYNNAILNSAGAVAIATLPHQQQQQQQQIHHNTSGNVGPQQQQPPLSGQTSNYLNHHKSISASGTTTTKINKLSSKYATPNMTAQLPPGTQLQQKSLGQQQTPNNQQYQNAITSGNNNNNSNIKFVNAQGTIIQQQQTLTPQKVHIKQQQQQQHHSPYPNLQQQNVADAIDSSSNHFSPQHITQHANNATPTNVGNVSTSPITSTIQSSSNSSQLSDDIMMVNGTQMTDELSARILQSMSQKSFINQRYQQLQQQQHQQPSSIAFQKSSPTPNNSSSNSNSNSHMLPPPQTNNATSVMNNSSATQPQITPGGASSSSHVHVNSSNNHSNILLSPREYTLYPPSVVGSGGSTQQQHQQQSASCSSSSSPSSQQQQQPQTPQSASPNHYSSNTSSTTSGIASVLVTPSPPSLVPSSINNNNNYLSNSMATITPHSSVISSGLSGGSGSSTSSSRLAQSAPNSRSQSMERKLHESSMSRKSTEYYKVNFKDFHQKCTTTTTTTTNFMAPTTGTIFATNSSSTAATSLIDFLIPLPSCTTLTTTNTLITSAACSATLNNNNNNNNHTNTNYNNNMSNCATMMTTTITSFSNHNNNQHSSNHNSLRGSHSNLAAAATAGHNIGGTNIAASTSSMSSTGAAALSSSLTTASVSGSATSNIMGSGATIQGGSQPPRPPSIPPPSTMLVESQAQVIHLQAATKTTPAGANNNSSNNNDDDDDIIGEEVRPVPVETHDIRLQILHAVLLDHTYANPMPVELPTTFAVLQHHPTASQGNTLAAGVNAQQQHWSLGGIGAVAAAGNGLNVPTTNYPMYSSQLSRLQQDDDAYSAISNSSRPALGDIDPGEETETAPEAEAEDDSITRCICDLTHDDGYMICCDKCCAWQHVDCMGIDRQNIPDEYLCELCQPRPVDKARARALQVQKRKEQTQLMLVQAQAVAAASTTGAAGSASGGANVANIPNELLTSQQRLSAGGLGGFGLNSAHSSDPGGLHQIATGGTNMKKGTKVLKKVKESVAGKKTKKADKLSAAAGSGLTGKAGRKETKKNTKRKKSSHDGSSGSTVGMTAAEKYAANIKQWSDHYEIAATNHYSPELRARLHSITKQPSLLQSILNTENPILKEYGKDELEHIAATVPHAGGKILISNLDIKPNSPICELRGKYMLTTQFKIQNTSINMNNPPPNNYQLASYKAHKTPGPFIFFYQLQGAEFTVNHGGGSGGNGSMSGQGQTTTTTTINPDGTFTTTTTTLPAQLSPPIFQKGPEICVDTRTYGNKARFVRRSCRPNAEIQHLFEKGTIHLFIVALADISANTEITIRHEPHDLLAVENKKTTTMVIQPTSTPCACGLSKDCIFGPPLPQLPPAAKSNAGRKSLALNGGGSTSAGAAMGNQSAKQRKAYQQNLNRNRSTSSSGDSNMGGSVAPLTPTIPTVALSLNSPNSLLNNKMCKNALGGNNVNGPMTLLPLTGSCNSNMSNASSSSSTLAGIMPDSGICTSSSSPSVSIPSPTPHMHSPIQQQQHQQQQSVQNSHLSQTQLIQQQQQQQQLQTQLPMRPAQLVVPPQQQQQQLMQSLPTPLILTTDMQQPILQQHQHHEQHHEQQQPAQQHQQVLLQSPQNLVHQQPLTVIAQAATATLISQEIAKEQTEQLSGHLHISTAPPSHLISQMAQPQLQLISPHHLQHHQQQTLTATLTPCSADVTAASPETAVAATALQSLNCSQTSNLDPAMDKLPSTQLVVMSGPMAATTPTGGVDIKLEEQAENIVVPVNQPPLGDSQVLTTQEMSNLQSGATTTVMASTVCSSANSSPQQKSPQKNSQSHAMHSHQGRKTPAKHGRTTSFSEDNDGGQHNDENAVSSAPNSSSTPKEKPKLSREDRKMEAILRAIEKMERNQQRKQEQKQSKRQNSGSHNTTPTSPNKTFDSADSSGTKRSNSQCGGPTRNKKKRKAGNRSAAHSNQRKRRQSRMNSQESIDGCGPQENDTVTSESDGCNAMLSPPIQTMAPLKDSPIAAAPNSTPVNALSCEAIPNNVDQAAGLLMAFANPPTIVNSIIQPTTTTTTSPPVLIPEVESPQRPAQYMMSSHESATSPPPTPPSHVSSACLLIEAAVGPLESSNLDTSSPTDIKDSEFKYPLQTKTKKLLMNNWLHRTEETTAPDMEQTTPHPLQAPAPQLSCVTGGLESLVQAALNDFKQSHVEENEMPQNLSFVAQRVEEFIQQTEGGPPTPPPTKHSYEYEHHHQQQQMYAMSAPAVDLSVKQHTTTPPPAISGVTKSPPTQNSTKNFHLPLQVSTCSNNSSVKKRWLRQAISEETHEETQNSYSMSPNNTTTPLTAAPPSSVNAFTMNPIVQQVQTTLNSSCSPALTTNSVPNGFTTPLKKRRLLLTDDKDEEDSVVTTVAMHSGEMQPSTPMSPPPVEAAIIVQPDNSLHKPEEYKAEVNQEAQEDVDVDVEKCEHNETTALEHHQQASTCTEHDQEQDQDQDVDVTSPPYEEQRVESEVVTKHENDLEIKKEPMEDSHNANVTTIVGSSQPQEFNDQEDDVDILRSPSPGREMIKAEDNLVKIEPEDTSGNEDVKIDVEREESMPAEDIVEPTTLKQEYKEEVTLNRPHENSEVSLKVEDVELKQEQKVVEKFENIPHHKEQQRPVEESKDKLLQVEKVENPDIKDEDTSKGDEDGDVGGEPKPKRIKLENIPAEIETTKPQQQQQQQTATVIVVKNEAKLLPLTPSLGKELKEEEPEENVLMKQMDVIKCEKLSTDTEEVSSTTSSVASQVVAKVAADSTFSGIESSTPPPHTVPPATVTPTQASCTSTVSPTPSLQRSKTLSDDDIQARLHNFHKENILFLQSRNKKSKSSNSSTSCNAMVNSCSSSSSGGSEHHRNSHKSNASSSSTNHHHHHHHHETSGGKERSEKSDKCSSKHHKNSSSSTTSLSGSSKKQKLHKRERTTSSSSSSNSHKNSSSQISSSSSATPASSSKHPAVNSSTNSLPSSSSCSASATASYSSSSSKKLKSLKKSSSGSSTSSSNSTSSCTNNNTSTLQNYHSSNTDNNKESKHQRQRTSSNNNNNTPINNASSTISSSAAGTQQVTFGGSSKKRQLNFELELTKDLHLVNSVPANSGKHKRQDDGQGHTSVKKSRKDSSSLAKEDQKSGSSKTHHKTISVTTTTALSSSSVHVEKSQEREKKPSPAVNVTTSVSSKSSFSSSSSSIVQAQTENPPSTSNSSHLEDVTRVVNVCTPSPSVNIIREHPTLPHFNNVVLTSATSANSTSITVPALPTAVISQAQIPPTPAQNIPVHITNSGCAAPPQMQSAALIPNLSPSLAGNTVASPTPNASSHLPFFNTIYGKLLDNPAPTLSSPVPGPCSAVSSIAAPNITPTAASQGVLSEYLDTKLKSYNTLGGYVNHTALFGLNNTPSKDVNLTKEGTNEMPAPPAPSAISGSAASSSSSLSLTLNVSTSPAMKILTKTASHDPRLNPQLTAPEPPPQPKRKLSINEYRKRMQQTSSNDSASNSLTSTPSTPPTPIENPPVGGGSIGTVVLNKCTLNSPERLTQSVDSQIQKEIIASSSLNSYDSLNSSNSSSTSNSSLMNDSLLKSSSLAEEDSTKGQFNAAPTLLEKQQESIIARLKSLKEKQGLALGVGSGSSTVVCSRSRFSSFSEGVGIGEYSLRKDGDDLDILGKRNRSISSSIGGGGVGGDLLDNCLEEISSTSTSMSSSREPSPERYIHTTSTNHYSHQSKHVVTASATTMAVASSAITNTSTAVCSNNNTNSSIGGGGTGQVKQHQHHHSQSSGTGASEKNSSLCTNLERKKSVDTA